MTPDQEISVHDAVDRMLFATERDGFTAVVIVDGSEDVDHQDVIEAFDDVGKELGHTAYVGSHLLGNRRARESRREEREEIVTDGGTNISGAGREQSAGKECPHCEDGVRHPDDGACPDCQRRFAEEAGVDG